MDSTDTVNPKSGNHVCNEFFDDAIALRLSRKRKRTENLEDNNETEDTVSCLNAFNVEDESTDQYYVLHIKCENEMKLIEIEKDLFSRKNIVTKVLKAFPCFLNYSEISTNLGGAVSAKNFATVVKQFINSASFYLELRKGLIPNCSRMSKDNESETFFQSNETHFGGSTNKEETLKKSNVESVNVQSAAIDVRGKDEVFTIKKKSEKSKEQTESSTRNTPTIVKIKEEPSDCGTKTDVRSDSDRDALEDLLPEVITCDPIFALKEPKEHSMNLQLATNAKTVNSIEMQDISFNQGFSGYENTASLSQSREDAVEILNADNSIQTNSNHFKELDPISIQRISISLGRKTLFHEPFFRDARKLPPTIACKDGIVITCVSCKKTIRGSLRITSNFIRHLKIKHPGKLRRYKQILASSLEKRYPLKAKLSTCSRDVAAPLHDSFAALSCKTLTLRKIASKVKFPDSSTVREPTANDHSMLEDSNADSVKPPAYGKTSAKITGSELTGHYQHESNADSVNLTVSRIELPAILQINKETCRSEPAPAQRNEGAIKESLTTLRETHHSSCSPKYTKPFVSIEIDEDSVDMLASKDDSKQECVPVNRIELKEYENEPMNSFQHNETSMKSSYDGIYTSHQADENELDQISRQKIAKSFVKRTLFNAPFFCNVRKVPPTKACADGIDAACASCWKKIKGSLRITSNFQRHLKLRHPRLFQLYQHIISTSNEKCNKSNGFDDPAAQIETTNDLPSTLRQMERDDVRIFHTEGLNNNSSDLTSSVNNASVVFHIQELDSDSFADSHDSRIPKESNSLKTPPDICKIKEEEKEENSRTELHNDSIVSTAQSTIESSAASTATQDKNSSSNYINKLFLDMEFSETSVELNMNASNEIVTANIGSDITELDDNDENNVSAEVISLSDVEPSTSHQSKASDLDATSLEKFVKTLGKKLLFHEPFFVFVQKLPSTDTCQDGIVVTCASCQKKMKGRLAITSNYIRHLKIQHPEMYALYQQELHRQRWSLPP